MSWWSNLLLRPLLLSDDDRIYSPSRFNWDINYPTSLIVISLYAWIRFNRPPSCSDNDWIYSLPCSNQDREYSMLRTMMILLSWLRSLVPSSFSSSLEKLVELRERRGTCRESGLQGVKKEERGRRVEKMCRPVTLVSYRAVLWPSLFFTCRY